LQNDQGIVTHYVGIQTDVSAAAEAGLLDVPEQLTEQQAAGALRRLPGGMAASGCVSCALFVQLTSWDLTTPMEFDNTYGRLPWLVGLLLWQECNRMGSSSAAGPLIDWQASWKI
jgi:hypothetical protein